MNILNNTADKSVFRSVVFNDNEIVTGHSVNFISCGSTAAIVGQKLEFALSPFGIYQDLATLITKLPDAITDLNNLKLRLKNNDLAEVSVFPLFVAVERYYVLSIRVLDEERNTQKLAEVEYAAEVLSNAVDVLDQAFTVYNKNLELVVWNHAFECLDFYPQELTYYGSKLEDAYLIMAEAGAFGDCGDPVAFVSMMMQKLRNNEFPKRSIIHSPFSQKVIEVKRYILPDGGLCVIFTDITKQEQYHQQLIDQAHTDSLTNILNRKGIISALDELIVTCNESPDIKGNELTTFYLLFIDLDLFKLANDTYGHKFGDALLALTSQRLSSLIDAENGDFLGRLGGDEFIIVLRSITQQKAVASFCQKIIESFTEPFKIDQQAVFISCSIGVSSYPCHGDSSESLLRKADTAMYHAKTQGRKLTQFYNAELSDKLTKSTLVVDELKSQLLNKRDELSLLYQPIINLRTMEIVGSEALLRWKPLNRFFLNTQQFIEMLEQRKMITEVGNIVFERALSTYQELRQKMPTKSRLSLNVSALQINHKDFADNFFEIRHQFDIPSEEIILELTETALLHNSHYVKDNMEAVRAEGINLAIDDFGTGFSSLSNLKEYPFTHLKIDRSFMDEMITNPRHRRLVGAILDLSRAFGLKTIAEGIETTEQLHFLRDKGCQFGQGYLFDKPLEIDQLLTRTNYQHLYTSLYQPQTGFK